MNKDLKSIKQIRSTFLFYRYRHVSAVKQFAFPELRPQPIPGVSGQGSGGVPFHG